MMLSNNQTLCLLCGNFNLGTMSMTINSGIFSLAAQGISTATICVLFRYGWQWNSPCFICAIANSLQRTQTCTRNLFETEKRRSRNRSAMPWEMTQSRQKLEQTNVAQFVQIIQDLANTYFKQDKYDKAIFYYKKSLIIRQRFVDDSKEQDFIAICKNMLNIGFAAKHSKNMEEHFSYNHKAIDLAQKKMGKNRPNLFQLIRIGGLAAQYYNAQRLEESIVFMLKALEIIYHRQIICDFVQGVTLVILQPLKSTESML